MPPESEKKRESQRRERRASHRCGDADSPREESEAREERARRRCGGEPRARRERQRVRLRANELGQRRLRARRERCGFILPIPTAGSNGRMGATPGIQRPPAAEPCRCRAGPYSVPCPGRHYGPEWRPRHDTKMGPCQALARMPSGRAVPGPC